MGQHPAHHGAAVYYFILRKGGAARKAQHLVHASAHRHAQHHGPGHCTAHGKVAVGHGFALQGARHIAEAFHIADHSAHLQGQAPLRHHSAQHFVDHDLFVAGGVKIAQFKNVHVRTVGHGLTHLPQSRRVLAFKADHAPLRARAIHHGPQPAQQFLGAAFQQVRVAHEQGLAAGAIDQNRADAGVGLYVRGQPGAAGAHHTRLADGLHNLISHDTLSFIEPFSYGGGPRLWPGGVYQARSSSSARSSSEGMRGLLWVQMSSRALAAMEGR